MIRLRRRFRPLGRLLRSVYSRRVHELCDFDLRAPIPDLAPSTPVTFRPATRDEVQLFLSDPDHEIPPDAMLRHLQLLDDGEPFFVGLVDGRIVYRAWAVRQRWRIAGSNYLKLGRGKATVLGCFTVASMRGRGIYPAALVAHLRWLKSQGVLRAFINAETANTASLRGIQKAGFRPLGRYESRRLLGRAQLIIEPGLRRAVESDETPR